MAKALSPWYDVNFVASSHLREWMLTGGVSSEKAQVLHVGVYGDEYHRNATLRLALRKQLNISPKATVVTLAARLDAMKQPLILCHAARAILNSEKPPPSLHFIVAGDGSEKNAMETCVSTHGLTDSFSFLGFVSMSGMKAVMSASDVLFLSSQMEGIPCVFYEAMAAGVPVIGPGVGGIAELVQNNVTGQVVDVKHGTEFDYTLVSYEEQIKRYTAALRQMVADPSRARQMGKAGEARIKNEFSIDKIVQKFIAVVNEKKADKARRGLEGACTAREDRGGGEMKLNEKASMGLAQGPIHMGTTPAYCPFT